jgi:hypothetical protein
VRRQRRCGRRLFLGCGGVARRLAEAANDGRRGSSLGAGSRHQHDMSAAGAARGKGREVCGEERWRALVIVVEGERMSQTAAKRSVLRAKPLKTSEVPCSSAPKEHRAQISHEESLAL